ncbi:MAG TPA: ABC transporter permease [Vicinamibacterales bacterium]|nr:ABC transporter permease [Vicinamibacterales bacterium]
MKWLGWTSAIVPDVKYGVRLLWRSPGFTITALLTLALGIGANTAIFSIVNGVILRPLAYPKPDQLMYLTTQFPSFGFSQFWVSPPEYMEFREMNRSFAAVGAFTTGEANLTAGDRPLRVRTAAIDEHLLKALGVPPEQGRLFAPGETNVNAPPPVPGQPTNQQLPLPAIVILSHELWQSAFGGKPIVGQTVELDGRRREVLGIMPPGTDVMDNRTEVWLPLGLNPANRLNRGNHYLYLIGRLKDGVTTQAAQTELDSLIKTWGERIGLPQKGPGSHVFSPLKERGAHILQMKPLTDEVIGGVSRSIWVLQAAVGFVLLIACANLANLLLARAETRHREFAVRTAIGATRGRLLQQFMTESVLLSIVGGALGLFVARVGVQALVRAYPASLPRTSEIAVDPAVLFFTFAVALASGVFFGLAPIMHTRVRGLVTALKEGGDKGATGAARHHVRRALVMAEVALAVMVVIAAGLLVRTVYNLTNVDAGFNRSRLVTFSITLPRVNYPQASARMAMFQRIIDTLRAVPGVQGASAMSGLPPNRPLNANDTDIDNYTAPPGGPYENVDYYQNVVADYFETMGIPIVQGRSFQPADAASTGMVAIVNERLVNTFWKGKNPIGQRLRPCCGDQVPWFTVVGVAKDVKQGGVDQRTGTEFYFFVDQMAALPPANAQAPATMNIALRTTLSASALASTVERTVREADRTVPVVRLREMEDVFAESIRRPRLLAQLIGVFAGLALLLAAIGTYGVLSYMVAERRREIGIRLALGADRSNVVAQVMKQGLVLTIVGVIVGVAGAFGVNRLMTSLLFGVKPTDAATLTGVIAAITLVAVAACLLPAWRASRLDPNVVLRVE